MSDSDSYLSDVPRYAVIRVAPECRMRGDWRKWDGRWLALDDTPEAWKPQVDGAVAVATCRYERREDGATARVYEVRP